MRIVTPSVDVEGRMVYLTSESCVRFLQESVRSVKPQPQSLLQRLWAVNARLVHRGCKNKGQQTQYRTWQFAVGIRTLLGDQQ